MVQKTQRNNRLWHLLFFALIAYLLINTGFASDDFSFAEAAKARNIYDSLAIQKYWLSTPLIYYTHIFWCRFFDIDNLLFANLLKLLYTYLMFYAVSRFFSIYLDTKTSLLVSFLFIFFPSHDATTYWFLGQHSAVAISLYLYAFYLAHREKLLPAFLAAVFSSFVSYGSPPIAWALFILFVLNKKLRHGLVLLIPNIIYSFYFIILTMVLGKGIPRIADGINIAFIAKQFALQILTFADAMFGPSMWLKIYYSFFQISLVSFFIGLLLFTIFYKTYERQAPGYDWKLALSMAILLFLSLATFALTGLLPQLTFNLGNRTTIYGSLLLSYTIALLPVSKNIRVIILIVTIFTILGISDHWKAWNVHEQAIMENIRNKQALKNYDGDKVIYVSGNQYSKYCKISHIEFFAQSATVSGIFQTLLGRPVPTSPLNRTFRYTDGYLIDTRLNRKTKVSDYINVYDSEKDLFFRLDAKDINKYIDSLPPDNRHWVQMWNVGLIKKLAARLMPKLKYAL